MGSDDDMLWNGSEEDGIVRSECEADEGTNCDNEDSDTDWWRIWHTVCAKCIQLIEKYFFADVLFLGAILDMINTFALGRRVIFEGSS